MVWNNFLAPFSSTLWFAIGVFILFLGFLLTWTYGATRRSKAGDVERTQYSLLDSWHCIFGLLCQQGHERTPVASSCRIIYWIAAVTSIILTSAYSASLVSSLTAHVIGLPFETFEGLLKDGSYKLGVLANSGHSNLLDTTSDELLRRLYKELVLPHSATLPISVIEGMQQVCRQHKYAFFTSKVAVQSIADTLECDVVDLPHASIPDNEGLILTKGSPYRNIISYNLMIIRNAGILSRMSTEEMPYLPTHSETQLQSVTFWQLVPIFTIVVAGLVSALLVLGAELVVAFYHLLLRRRKIMRKEKIHVALFRYKT